MPKLPVLSGKRLVHILKQYGFVVKRTSASHFLLEHPDGRMTTIPVHASRDLPKGTLRSILRDIEITNDQLRDML